MFWNLLTIENIKTLRRSMLWIELAFLAIMVSTIFVMVFVTAVINTDETLPPGATQGLRERMPWPGGLTQALGIVNGNGIGGLLIVILVGAITAQEYTWRTMQLWLCRGVSRPMLLAAKATATLLPIAMLVLTAFLVGSIVSGIFTLVMDGNLHIEQINLAALLLSILRTACTLLPYAGLAFFLGIATRSTAATIGGGLAYLLLLENILMQALIFMGDATSQLIPYLPGNLANALLSQNTTTMTTTVGVTEQAQSISFLAPAPAAIGIAIWTLAFVVSALLIFRQQDLSE